MKPKEIARQRLERLWQNTDIAERRAYIGQLIANTVNMGKSLHFDKLMLRKVQELENSPFEPRESIQKALKECLELDDIMDDTPEEIDFDDEILL